jgi:O-acetyl-ADP-ribose deacetylase (regulator of RNase III)
VIEEVKGNLLKADVEAYVNPVNTVGVMGAGLALQFRNTFPAMFAAYQQACYEHQIAIGTVHVWPFRQPGENQDRYIINFPTKTHWRGTAQPSYIDDGLADLVRVIDDLSIKTIAVPALGCGLGGLAWTTVRSRIHTAFAMSAVHVMLYVPWVTE